MERSRTITVDEGYLKIILERYGGPEGLVYFGFRLSTLTPEQRTEYFRLKEEELRIKGKKDTDSLMKLILKDDSLKIPTTVKEYREILQNQIKQLEKIMDEKTRINKKEFIEQLYL